MYPYRLLVTRTKYRNGELECKHAHAAVPCGLNEPDGVIPRETNIDDVVQVNNIFINVSKGEVAKTEDLKKAFGKVDRDTIVREVMFS